MTSQDRDLLERTFLRELAGILYHDLANSLTVVKTRSAVLKRKIAAPAPGSELVTPFLENLSSSVDRMNDMLMLFRNRDGALSQIDLPNSISIGDLFQKAQKDLELFYPAAAPATWPVVNASEKIQGPEFRLRLALVILAWAKALSPQSTWTVQVTKESWTMKLTGLAVFEGLELFHSQGHPYLELAVVKKILNNPKGRFEAEFQEGLCRLEISYPI